MEHEAIRCGVLGAWNDTYRNTQGSSESSVSLRLLSSSKSSTVVYVDDTEVGYASTGSTILLTEILVLVNGDWENKRWSWWNNSVRDWKGSEDNVTVFCIDV